MDWQRDACRRAIEREEKASESHGPRVRCLSAKAAGWITRRVCDFSLVLSQVFLGTCEP